MSVQTFSIGDLDQAIAVGNELFYDHRLVPLRDWDSFRMDLSAGSLGSVRVGLIAYHCSLESRLGGFDDAYAVTIPLRGELHGRIGPADVRATPERAALLGPVGAVSCRGWATPDDTVLTLRFDRPALEFELSRMLGRDIDRLIRLPLDMDLRSGAGAQWAQLARFVASALRAPEGLAWNPLFAAQLSSTLMTGLLLAADHDHREVLEARTSSPAPAVIQRAVDIIESRAHEPLTIPLVAAEVGVSVRSLQRGFLERFDTTPSRYLVRVRMARVHRDLLARGPEWTSVSQVAKRWGFTHMGRFAADYRAQFGKSPSETLRQR